MTKDQNVLYNLFDWPHQPHARLVTVGVANTIDLPEKFMPKITSRIGNRRLVYKPYTSQQIEQIIRTRLVKLPIFEPDAITFACKKIATFSSDIRRTLHVCRNAVQTAMKQFTEFDTTKTTTADGKQVERVVVPVKIEHIQHSYNELYSSALNRALKMLPKYSKLTVIALALEIKKSQSTSAWLANVNFSS